MVAVSRRYTSKPLVAVTLSLGVVLIVLSLRASVKVSAQTAITLVQHTSKDGGTTSSTTLAFPAANKAGNWLAVAIRAGLPNEAFTVTDSRGNTYRKAVQFTETGDNTSLAIFYAENVAGGANTVTVSDSLAATTLRLALFEYSGVASANSLDGTSAAQGTSSTPASGPAATTTSGDLVLGLVTTANARTFTAGSGFTGEEVVPAGAGKLFIEDTRFVATGPVTASATLNSADIWGAAVATFHPAPSGPPTPDLTLALAHNGTFTQGQVGATYTLTATNSGTAATSGTITVSTTVPTGLTATAITGTGWTCPQPAGPCSRADGFAAGASAPPLTLTVTVASNAPASVTTSATVAGGGEANTLNDSATDNTSIGLSPSQVGQWSPVMNWPIVAVHAILLPTGNVLAWTDYTINGGAQIWRPATNTFVDASYSAVSLFCAGHALLSDSRLLVTGGIVGLTDDLGPRDSTVFNPTAEA